MVWLDFICFVSTAQGLLYCGRRTPGTDPGKLEERKVVLQQYFGDFSAWASKLRDPQTGNTFADIFDGQIGEHNCLLVITPCVTL